jgi:hypothetical protein
MTRKTLTFSLATLLIVAAAPPLATAQDAQAPKAEKKLTPQQQKLKDCGAQWQTMKKEGKTAELKWTQFRKDCMKKT